MELNNTEVAGLLREVAAAYTLKKVSVFQIRAYENAASSIEHATSEVKDLWEEGNLDQIPGIGESIKSHLEELFITGKVKHWEEVKRGIPPSVFFLLDVPGIGPKTALTFAELGVKDVEDLTAKLQSGFLVRKGFSEKISQKLLAAVQNFSPSDRMLLPYAFTQAERVIESVKSCPFVQKIDALGSLRRMVATVGDLDFAVASDKAEKVVECLTELPMVAQVEDKGEEKVTLFTKTGLRLDFLITHPSTYGALLQHFTGSKAHNIHLRTLAEKKGLSLSEHGIKKVQSGEVIECRTEEELYDALGMQTPPPEIREDTGEIEAALAHQLPKFLELQDIKGELHLHDNFPIEPSHDLGVSTAHEIIGEAKRLGYEYIGISDHSPSVGNHTPEQIVNLIKKHTKYLQDLQSKNDVRVLNLLEIDIQPDGSLSVPDDGLKLLDFAIASVHSRHQMSKEEMTRRILRALENPYVKVLGHPTGRLINRRESYGADWQAIFKYAVANNKAMEINSFPDRLDLPDNLVRMAKNLGVKLVINTDSHQASQMELIRFGVAVARRGWLTKEDVVNCWDWTKFSQWFMI